MIKNQIRIEERQLRMKRLKTWSKLSALGSFLRGSICTLKRPCTRKQCSRCKKGTRHPTTYFSVKQHGQTTLVYLPKTAEATARKMLNNGEKARALLERLMDYDIALLRLDIKKLKQ